MSAISILACHLAAGPGAVKEALYRIAQEALHNIARHARARTVDLTLQMGAGCLIAA